MLYEELKSLRDECQKITFDEWVDFWRSQNCGAEYALKNWNSFRDGPMLFITWHTSGSDLLYYILSFIDAPRKAVSCTVCQDKGEVFSHWDHVPTSPMANKIMVPCACAKAADHG